ncbi:hypothetical protein [Pontibacter pamirensis]|uniref:hypothetical protein n=1 Tax=Pontibacter pamirensis TaxID=2562824 RepID=UPI001389BC07|nr:hypothetical protein [Pontibacter pamirensis]
MRKVTTSNYLEVVKNLDFSTMPEAISESHQITLEAMEDSWSAYQQVPEIKDMVDTYFEKLVAFLPEEKPALTYSKKKLDPNVLVVKPKYDSRESRMAKGKGGRSAYSKLHTAIKDVSNDKQLIRMAQLVDEAYEDEDISKVEKEELLKMMDRKSNETQPEEIKQLKKELTRPKQTKPRKAKAPKPKKVKQPKYKAPVAYHDHFTDEEKVIKRFVAMDGKVKTEKQVKLLLDTVNKLVVERKIRKISHNAEVIKMVQKKLTTAIRHMRAEKEDQLQLSFADDTLSMLKKFTKQSKVYSTVQLLKRFIPMQGTTPDKEKAKKLMDDITRAMTNGAVQKSDTYYGDLQEAVMDLNAVITGANKFISFDSPTLSGLGCPGTEDAECGCNKDAVTALAGVAAAKKKVLPKVAPERKVKLPGSLAGIFTQIDQPGVDTKKNTFRLQGDIGKLLGNIERKEYAIALRGDKGAGKTSFLYQLMDAFAEQGFNVASFTLEIDKQSDLVQRMTQKFIKPKNRSRIQAASIAPDGITTIREAAKYFDVVAIDSFSKLNANQMEFDKLRKDFPNTFFLVIFQSTTAGTARGGAAAEYDAGVVIQVDEPGVALCEKNRYADADSMGLKYLVHECKLSNDKAS